MQEDEEVKRCINDKYKGGPFSRIVYKCGWCVYGEFDLVMGPDRQKTKA